MRFFAFLFIILFLSSFALEAKACKFSPLTDDEIQKLSDEAYYIGLVFVDEIELYARGNLKSVKFTPFAVYLSAPEVNLKNEISVRADEENWTSCDVNISPDSEIAEVLILKENDKLKLMLTDVLMPDYIHKLRQNMRYVGAE